MEESRIDVESIPDAVVVVDPRGRIVQVNAHTEAMFGYSRGELRGQQIEMLVPELLRDEHAAHRRGYEEAPRNRAMGAGQNLAARHRSGREVPVEIMLSPGAAGTVVAIVRDISVRRELERFRDEYLGYISHDLKNPLSIIALQARLLLQRLADRDLDEERGAVDTIAQCAVFIDRLVRLGLGLYISQKIIKAHDGLIGVDGASGTGSRFFFELPIAGDARPRDAVPLTLDVSADKVRERLRGVRVLIVDDEPIAVSALGELLRDEGMLVSTATTGAQALGCIEPDPPDAAVLDVEMPGMSGLVLLQRLRERLPHLPAVFMTGYMPHHAGIAKARVETGAGYISKPVDVDELLRALVRALPCD
jgi:PAS domain S-box-containing protein